MKTARLDRNYHAPLQESLALWSRFANDNTAMLFGAGEVIGKRTARMVTHGIAPNAEERLELQRMIEEKHSAMMEGSIAAWREFVRISQAGWLEAVRLVVGNGINGPVLAGLDVTNVIGHTQRVLAHTVEASMESVSRQMTAPLDTHLRIADAAFAPVRATVAANRKRL